MKKTIMALAIALSLIVPAFMLATPVKADDLDVWGPGGESSLQTTTGLGAQDPRTIIAKVINIILGFLGIIAVVIILLGGFKWMTAGGNEEKVEESKKLIRAGIIGLVIILAAWGIASFVVSSLIGATTTA